MVMINMVVVMVIIVVILDNLLLANNLKPHINLLCSRLRQVFFLKALIKFVTNMGTLIVFIQNEEILPL